ncbi:RNAPII degradation factor, partial [Coemansia sp. RSA 2681]
MNMSAAPPNTHQASYSSSRGNKVSRGGSSNSRAPPSSADEAAEFKILRSKHLSSLRILNEMYPDWTDADLLSAIEEANGDLTTTIDHISDGFASQWGEVKSRKEKRQVPKQHDDSKPAEKSSYVPRPASFRGGVRGGAARGGRAGPSHAASSRVRTASIARAPAASAPAADETSGWEVIDTSADSKSTTAGAWDTKPAAQEPKPREQTVAVAAAVAAPVNTAPAKPAPVSWASIAKRQVHYPVASPNNRNGIAYLGVKQTLPEPAKPVEQVSESAQPELDELAADEAEAATATTESAPAPNVDQERLEAETEPVVVVEDVVEVVEESVETTVSSEQPPFTQEPESQTAEAVADDGHPAVSVSSKKAQPNSRRLHQDAPVVMPMTSTTLERIGMQFGSLSIGGVELSTVKPAAAVSAPAAEPAAPSAEIKEAAPAPEPAPAKVEAAPAPAAPAPAVAPAQVAEQVPASAQGPLTAYLQQQQQQQQQHTQSHVQPNIGAISQMPLPNDYGAAALYGAEAQRNVMGFYDNYGYGQFVGSKDNSATAAVSAAMPAADAQSSATNGAQAVGINGSTNVGQAGIFPQQIPQPFGMSHAMPYYNPYYYSMMQPGSQFPNPAAFGNNPALAAAYGQPFMKQGMYPMYPGATPQALQGAGAQPGQQQQTQPQQQQPQQSGQQGQAGVQQQGQAAAQQASAQQQGAKGSAVGSQGSAAQYGNINAQKAGNPYGHYAANIGAGF